MLIHLHARYCKRLSDEGVRAIALRLENLYTLDLSFCTRVSSAAIVFLLETRGQSLAELRLQSCRNLDIGAAPDFRRRINASEAGSAGRGIVDAIQSHGIACSLSSLDVRDCGGQPPDGAPYKENDPFVTRMIDAGFQQRVAGYFGRPARWNAQIERRLVGQFLKDTPCASPQ